MPHDHEYDPTLQSPSERRSLLSQGVQRLRRLFVQVANITTLRTDTITERTDAAGVTIDTAQIKDNGIVFVEAADHPITPVATKGQVWVKTASPNELWFTNDAGTDVQLGAGGGGQDLATDTLWAAQGDLVKGTGDDAADILTIGADHTILVSNGSDPSWSAAPPLANIADTGDTNRITLATSSPHLTLTGNTKLTGTLGVFGSIPDPLNQIMFKINAAQSITDSWDGIFINPTITSIGLDRRIVGVLGTVINKYAVSNSAGIFGLRFGLASWPTATGLTISEQTACLVENAIVNQSTTASTITEMSGFKTTALAVTQVSGTMTIGTLYGLYVRANARSVATTVISNAHAIRVEDWTGTSFPAGSTLLEIGSSTPTTTSGLFRMDANFSAAANETPIHISEGATPTVRQLKTAVETSLDTAAGTKLICYLA